MGVGFTQVDIAVDPLEGTNLCATGAPNAIAVLAASSSGGLLHAPDLYMEKLVVGPSSKNDVSLDAPVEQNLKAIARSLGRAVEDLVVIVLERPRHKKLIDDIRATGARIRLIGDGDLSAGIAAAVVGSGVHAVMGTGGAPEGVLTAAAMRCLNGEIFARLVVSTPEHEERCRAMPILPLFIGQLGVTDVGEISMWTGLSLGVTPGLTALLSPVWGRLGDRFGRKIMVERSLVSFVVLFAAMAYVTRVWQVLAIRIVQGLFAGYGSLSVAMAAESAPRDRMPNAIGTVQTAQRIGPAVGPVRGGVLAALVGLRRAFVVTALFYGIALVIVHLMY